MMDRIAKQEYMMLGGIMTSQTAVLVCRGLRTLPMRMQRHAESGLLVAEHIASLPRVTRLNHPGLKKHPQHDLALRQMTGFSSLFSFEADVPFGELKEWANQLRYFEIGVSWGGFESLVTVQSPHYEGEQTARNVVRLYIGLEDPEVLIRDIDDAWLWHT